MSDLHKELIELGILSLVTDSEELMKDQIRLIKDMNLDFDRLGTASNIIRMIRKQYGFDDIIINSSEIDDNRIKLEIII